jgi:hypothetical protein
VQVKAELVPDTTTTTTATTATTTATIATTTAYQQQQQQPGAWQMHTEGGMDLTDHTSHRIFERPRRCSCLRVLFSTCPELQTADPHLFGWNRRGGFGGSAIRIRHKLPSFLDTQPFAQALSMQSPLHDISTPMWNIW